MTDARHGQGVVVGDGATQLNTYHVTRIDASTLPQPEQVTPTGRWEVPHCGAEVFVGRGELLAGLRAAFTAGMPGQCLVGLGGAGKSRVAIEYAYAFRDAYPSGVFWVSAEDDVSLSLGLAALARGLSAAWHAMPDGPAAGWAVSWLRQWPGWLLILDDVTAPEHVAGLLGRLSGAGGDLLVTTRRDLAWRDGRLTAVPVGMLDPASAAGLLLGRTGQDDRAAADSIAAEVGHLPLALEQAAAYVRFTATTLERYLTLLREQPATAFAASPPGLPGAKAVARVWDITLDALQEADPLAAPLLATLSWLGPEDVPRDLLDALRTGAESAGLLASYSMITLTAEAIGVHRLVQAVIRAQSAESEAPDGLMSVREAAVELLLRSLPGDPARDVAGWPRWRRLLPHIVALAERMPAGSGLDDRLGLLLNEAGQFELSQGRAEAGTALLTRALERTTAAFGTEHPHVAVRLNNLAGAHHRAGRTAEAAELAGRALRITEAVAGADSPDMIIRWGALGALQLDQGHAGEALELHARALARAEREPEPDRLLLARTLVNISACHRRLGRLADAEAAARRALALTEAELGPDHPEAAGRQSTLASIRRAQGRPDLALPHELRALAIAEAGLPADHPDLADHLDQLGVTYADLGRTAEALPLLGRAAAILEAAPGVDPALLTRVLGNLATVRLATGDVPAGLLEHAIATARDPRDQVGPLNNLAVVHERQGRPGDALAAALRAVRIADTTGHPELAASLSRAASAHLALGDPEEAVALQQRALRIAQAALGPRHHRLAEHRTLLADAYAAQGRRNDARRLYRRALRDRDDDPTIAPLLATVGIRLSALGDEPGALAAFERAVRIVERAGGPEPAELAEVLGCAAVSYRRLGRRPQALAAARRAAEIAGRCGPVPAELRRLLTDLESAPDAQLP